MALIILNIFMIYQTVYKQKFALKHASDLSNRKKRQITISVVILTMLFIMLTFPGAIVSGLGLLTLLYFLVKQEEKNLLFLFFEKSCQMVIKVSINRKFQ